jgi:site-specific DNA-methyltransferase (adenine-specific)
VSVSKSNVTTPQPDTFGQIRCGDCRSQLEELADNSVRLSVFSPPYNIGKDYDEYDDRVSESEWKRLLSPVFLELKRIIKPDGKVVVNVGKSFADSDVEGRFHFYPLASWVKFIARDAGFDLWDEYLWDKRGFASRGGGALMGSYPYPTNFMASQRHEHILVFRNWVENVERERNIPPTGTEKRELSALTKERWRELTQSLWEIEPVTQSQFPIDHGAVYPVELPRRAVQLYSFYGDTVLDPFIGTGTTAVAAKQCGRKYVGFDVDSGYIEHARKRVSDTDWFSFPELRQSAMETLEDIA